MKQFDVPVKYRSGLIGRLKELRRKHDPRKQDFSPSVIDCGAVKYIIPRHFGFCYGVENAIEITYRALRENPGKRIYLISQMIHNPAVNRDLEEMGVRFVMDTEGNELLPWSQVQAEDVVITPAFGTTVEIEKALTEHGVVLEHYNTTCPFVEKVWKRSAEIGRSGFTVIIHGKYRHEETRATFSHSMQNAPSLVLRNMAEAELLGQFISGQLPADEFQNHFSERCSPGFDPAVHLQRIGVVNQTTMLATETQAIADYFRQLMKQLHGERYTEFFADTRDTLCYATYDNQEATAAVLPLQPDLALVVGGYNSSNTSQLAEILATQMPVFFIASAEEISDRHTINHFHYPSQQKLRTAQWLPAREKVTIAITSGASCPDTVVEQVLEKVHSFFPDAHPLEQSIEIETR